MHLALTSGFLYIAQEAKLFVIEGHRSNLLFIKDLCSTTSTCHHFLDRYPGVLRMGAIAVEILDLDPKFSRF